MHIADGVLPGGTLVTGFILAGGWIVWQARKLDAEDMPRVAVMSAAFFVGSYIPIPLGVTSIHLLLHGLVGIVLGNQAMLAIGLGLLFQKILLGHGGVTTLGVNACIMGFPAVLLGWVFHTYLAGLSLRLQIPLACVFTGCTVALSTVLAALVLLSGGEEFQVIAVSFIVGHVVIVVIEAAITGVVLSFLSKVKPELLYLTPLPPLRRTERGE